MKDRPILFNGEMVRAILAGRKTQTRRPINPTLEDSWCDVFGPRQGTLHIEPWRQGGKRDTWETCWSDNGKCWMMARDETDRRMYLPRSPFGVPGDRLCVRETCRAASVGDSGLCGVEYAADNSFVPIENSQEAGDRWMDLRIDNKDGTMNEEKWRPSIHMPRWASRINPPVRRVWVERLLDMTTEDFIAEGILSDVSTGCLRAMFFDLWDSIYGKTEHKSDNNPWVGACEFERIKP